MRAGSGNPKIRREKEVTCSFSLSMCVCVFFLIFQRKDMEGKRGHLFNFAFTVFFCDNFSKEGYVEGKRGHLFNFTFTFNVLLCINFFKDG